MEFLVGGLFVVAAVYVVVQRWRIGGPIVVGSVIVGFAVGCTVAASRTEDAYPAGWLMLYATGCIVIGFAFLALAEALTILRHSPDRGPNLLARLAAAIAGLHLVAGPVINAVCLDTYYDDGTVVSVAFGLGALVHVGIAAHWLRRGRRNRLAPEHPTHLRGAESTDLVRREIADRPTSLRPR